MVDTGLRSTLSAADGYVRNSPAELGTCSLVPLRRASSFAETTQMQQQNLPTIPEVRHMSEVERSEAQMRVAVQSAGHLIQWAESSGRRWLIFDTPELIRALPWPEGVETLMQMVACYRDHRATQPSTEGGTIEQSEPGTNKIITVPKTKPETLEREELIACIRYLVDQVKAIDPGWSLESLA
jgi:hypothetical protein